MRQTRMILLFGAAAAIAARVVPAAAQQKLSLAKPEAETTESFTRIGSVRELPSGKVLVVDPSDKIVQLVDFTAGAVTRVGREGQGPGEYALPQVLLAQPNGETLLWDLAGRRFLSIGPDGKPGGIIEMPRPSVAPPGTGGPVFVGLTDIRGVDSKGRIYFQGSAFNPNGGAADSIPILRWERPKPAFDTVGYVKSPPGTSATRTGSNVRFTMGGGKVWTPQEAWDIAGNGMVARVTPSPYRVIWISGITTAAAGPIQPFSPIKVTQADKDLYLANRRKTPPTIVTIGGGSPRISSGGNVPLPDPEFEETMPPFSGRGVVLATPEGEVWVLRTRPAADMLPTYDVFDRTGAVTKRVNLQPNSRVVGFGNGTVYVVRTDEDDLQYLQRYRRP